MSRILLVLCLTLMLGGCRKASDVDGLKSYLAQTPPDQIQAVILFRKLKAAYEPLETGIPHLMRLTESKEPTDAVTAYVALSELCAQVRMTPTPEEQAQLERINPKALVTRFDAFDTSVLSGNWQAWFSKAHMNMKRGLEQPAPDDRPKAPPVE